MELIDFIRDAMEENKMRIENILFMKIRYRYFEVASNISTGGLSRQAGSQVLSVCLHRIANGEQNKSYILIFIIILICATTTK